MRAGMTAVSSALLLYSALMVPIQLSFWITNDPCSLYPTVPFLPAGAVS